MPANCSTRRNRVRGARRGRVAHTRPGGRLGRLSMGVLHKLTLALRRLDPHNTLWEKLQKEQAGRKAGAAFEAATSARGTRSCLTSAASSRFTGIRFRTQVVPDAERHLRRGHPAGGLPDCQAALLHLAGRRAAGERRPARQLRPSARCPIWRPASWPPTP